MAARVRAFRNRRAAGRPWSALVLCAALASSTCGSSSHDTTIGPSPVRCQLVVTPAPIRFPAGGGSGTLTVTAARECVWSASSDAAWISLAAPSTGQGSGTIQYAVAPNPQTEIRRGSLAVGSHSAQITQEAAACRFEVERRSVQLPAQASGADVPVRAPAGCTWTAKPLSPWISIVDGAQGTGPGRVRVRTAANPTTAPRSGALEIADQRVDIHQSGIPCRYAIDPTASEAGPGETAGAIGVQTEAGCPWAAASDRPWLAIVEGESGEGGGQVRYRAAFNDEGVSRSARITVNDLVFTLRQAPCQYSVTPSSASFGVLGGTGEIEVRATEPCEWSASASETWIRITAGADGSGDGRVRYAVLLNALTGTRTGGITIAGRTVSIAQAGATSLSGPITEVKGSCPDRRFMLRGQRVRTTRDTDYEGGTCGALIEGAAVRVKGPVGSDGVLTASEVDFH